mmetsp:Transcript_16566/g.44842  ORF Transcript_16566/g.44842 Transcript_16566/m.44842 type:complete len:218 (-) Transcript_16566:209-862(-)
MLFVTRACVVSVIVAHSLRQPFDEALSLILTADTNFDQRIDKDEMARYIKNQERPSMVAQLASNFLQSDRKGSLNVDDLKKMEREGQTLQGQSLGVGDTGSEIVVPKEATGPEVLAALQSTVPVVQPGETELRAGSRGILGRLPQVAGALAASGMASDVSQSGMASDVSQVSPDSDLGTLSGFAISSEGAAALPSATPSVPAWSLSVVFLFYASAGH